MKDKISFIVTKNNCLLTKQENGKVFCWIEQLRKSSNSCVRITRGIERCISMFFRRGELLERRRSSVAVVYNLLKRNHEIARKIAREARVNWQRDGAAFSNIPLRIWSCVGAQVAGIINTLQVGRISRSSCTCWN